VHPTFFVLEIGAPDFLCAGVGCWGFGVGDGSLAGRFSAELLGRAASAIEAVEKKATGPNGVLDRAELLRLCRARSLSPVAVYKARRVTDDLDSRANS
jgi:hypothetical protein